MPPAIKNMEDKIDEILTILRRIEARQIRTTEMVEKVKESESPPMGSFGNVDV